MVRSLVFAFPIVPRNYTRFDAANTRSPVLERPLISLSGPSAKSPTPHGVRDSWAPCTHHPWQKLPYTVTRFCLLPMNWKNPILILAVVGRISPGFGFQVFALNSMVLVRVLVRLIYPQLVVAPTTCSLTTCLTTCMVYRKQRRIGGGVYRKQRRIGGGESIGNSVENSPGSPLPVETSRRSGLGGRPRSDFQQAEGPRNLRGSARGSEASVAP